MFSTLIFVAKNHALHTNNILYIFEYIALFPFIEGMKHLQNLCILCFISLEDLQRCLARDLKSRKHGVGKQLRIWTSHAKNVRHIFSYDFSSDYRAF